MKPHWNIQSHCKRQPDCDGNALFSRFTFTGKDPRKGWRAPFIIINAVSNVTRKPATATTRPATIIRHCQAFGYQ